MSATIMKSHRRNIEVSLADLMNARKIFLKPWLLVSKSALIFQAILITFNVGCVVA